MAVYEDATGTVWFGTPDGVVRLQEGTTRLFTAADGLPEGPVIEIAEAEDGSVWASTRVEEVARFDGRAWAAVPEGGATTFNSVHRIYPARDGTLWLASSVDGVIHTDGASWTRYSAGSGLPSTRVWDVCQDAEGRFWFATGAGLACYDPDMMAPETHFVAPPTKVAPYQSVLMRYVAQDSWKRTPSQELLFSWRVDGGEWSPYSRDDRALLHDLSSGAHRFEVRAMDREYNQEPTPAVHMLTVMAPVWQQAWFLALSGVSALALLVSSGYALQRHQRWREAQARLIEELDSELRTAHEMQMSLLPTAPLSAGRLEVAGRCEPANHVGGDYFNFFWLDEARGLLGFAAADVSGKAMEAAVHVMQLSGVFGYEFRQGRPLLDVLGGLHVVLRKHLDATSFVTGCIGTLEVGSGRVDLGNAAHPFPFHYHAQSAVLETLEMPSLPLGITLPPDAVGGHAQAEAQLEPGDVLVLYSDGVTDLQNAGGDFYGEERLESLIRSHAPEGAQALVRAVFADLGRFRGSTPQVDDLTLLALCVRPERQA